MLFVSDVNNNLLLLLLLSPDLCLCLSPLIPPSITTAGWIHFTCQMLQSTNSSVSHYIARVVLTVFRYGTGNNDEPVCKVPDTTRELHTHLSPVKWRGVAHSQFTLPHPPALSFISRVLPRTHTHAHALTRTHTNSLFLIFTMIAVLKRLSHCVVMC